MKTRFYYLLLLLLVLGGVNDAWAQGTATLNKETEGWNSIKTPTSSPFKQEVSVSPITFSFVGTSSNKVAVQTSGDNAGQLKFQASTQVTISGEGIYITSIVINTSGNNHIFTESSNALSFSDKGATQTWTATSNVSSVTLQAADNIYVSSIVVSYTTASTNVLNFSSQTALTNLPLSGTITIDAGENIQFVNEAGARVSLYNKSEYDSYTEGQTLSSKITSQTKPSGATATFAYAGLEYDTQYILVIDKEQYKSSTDENKKNAIQTFTYTTVSAASTLTVESNRYWNDWSSYSDGNHSSTFVEGNIEFYATSSKNVKITTSGTTTIGGKDYTGSVYFQGTDNYLHFKVAPNSKITVYKSSQDEDKYMMIDLGSRGGTNLGKGSNVQTVEAFTAEGGDIYVYSSNSGAYIYGIQVQPTLSQFEFNPDDVYYYNNNTGEFVNSTTFEKNDNYDNLRVKLKITPDYGALGTIYNNSFTVTSSNSEVLDVSDVSIIRASDNRLYVNGIRVKAVGTCTLTFTFTGSGNYAGPVTCEQSFTVTPATAPALSMTTPATATGVAVTTNIVLSSDRALTAVDATIDGTLNGAAITFALSSDHKSLTYTPGASLATGTVYTVKLNANEVKGSNGVQNTEQTFSFTTVAPEAGLTAVSDKVWNFSEWSTQTFRSSQIVEGENIEVITANEMSVDGSNKSYTDEELTLSLRNRLKTGGGSNASNRLLHFKVSKGATITVLAMAQGSSSRSLNLCTGSYNASSPAATVALNNSTMSKLTYTYNGEASEADIYLGGTDGTAFYYIKVSSGRTSVALRPGGSQVGTSESNPIASSTTSFSFLIVTTVGGDKTIGDVFGVNGSTTTISSENFEITSSNPSVVDVSAVWYSSSSGDQSKSRFGINNLKPGGVGGASTITLRYKGSESFTEATTTFTIYVDKPQAFGMNATNLTVQAGQRAYIMPTITNASGQSIGFSPSGAVIVLDDEETIDYDDYFDFTYSISSNDAGLTLDATDNSVVVSENNANYIGKKAVVTITARPKSEYAAKFTNSSVTRTIEVEVIARASGNYINFWLDADKTERVTDEYAYTLDGSTSVFSGFPNGRVIYADINAAGIEAGAEEIWFSYNVGSSVNVTPSKYGKTDYGKKQYLLNAARGGMVPIHIDNDADLSKGVYVNFQCYKRTGKDEDDNVLYESVGSVIPVKFNIVSHDRPVIVTYDPAEENTIRNTAQNVLAIGTTGNDVYAKFSSTGTNYTIEGLVNEPNVIYDKSIAGVFSTEVGPRKISGVQIQLYGDDPFVSTMTSNVYQYLFATTLKLSQYEYHIDLTSEGKYAETFTIPTATATYYDKVQKKDIDASSGDGISYTYSVVNSNGANVSVNENTGAVNLGTNSGQAVISVTYTNTNNITVNNRTSTMEVATTTYRIYLTKSGEHLPKISPASTKFYPSIDVTVTADSDDKNPTEAWDAYYIVLDVNADAPTGEYIKTNGTKVDKNKSTTFTVNETKKVYAVAYNGSDTYSAVINETYTLGEKVNPPTFVPDGTVEGGWIYYTETLPVEARATTLNSDVYYTITVGETGTTPSINSPGTYKYDGLQGITLGDDAVTTIVAFAYKDGIYSEIVTAKYRHSGLETPHFSINGIGKYKSGSQDVTTTDNIAIGSDANAGGLTLVHYYTLDGTEPTAEYAMRYSEAFNVITTVTGRAMTALVNGAGEIVAQSASVAVTFNISGEANNVWEAVAETTPGGIMLYDDGVVISTNESLSVTNTGSKVNTHSIKGNTSGYASKMYAQADITVTFGGDVVYDKDEPKNRDWSNMTIADAATGSPIDGVGTYSIKSVDNAKMETSNTSLTTPSDNYNHIYARSDLSTHERTFRVPSKGTFVKFEPEKDGVLTIWGLQQGSLNFHEDKTLCDKFIRFRPVYFLDEQGHSLPALEAISSARLSGEWAKIVVTAEADSWTPFGESQTIVHDGQSVSVENKGLSAAESKAIYNIYKKYLDDNNIKIGEPINPFPVHKGTTISQNNSNYSDDSNDNTGYVMVTGGYVRYKFEVKAGKTYYFCAVGSKIGIRGFQFVPTETAGRTTVTINPESKSAATVADKPVVVTLQRKFTAGQWTSLVLPFSVSTTQVEKVFGSGTQVVHFNEVRQIGTKWYLILMKHYYQMIVAGTPVLIKPKTTVKNPVFNGVQIEASAIDEMKQGTEYTMTGALDYADGYITNGDYFIANKGKFMRWTGNSTAMRGSYAWLRPSGAATTRELTFNFEDIVDGTTGIIEVDGAAFAPSELVNGNVYDLRGVKVSSGSLKELPKGIYIVNGKKVVVD